MLSLTFAAGEAPAAGRRVNEWRDDSGTLVAQGFRGGEIRWIDWPELGVFAFSTGSLEVQFWPAARAERDHIYDAFARMLQPVIMQALGWEALHASAALTSAGVVAFCGRSGSGKSTLAFAMHTAGLQQFADDSVVLRFSPEGIMACPMPFKPGLRPPSREHFHNNGSISHTASSCDGERPLCALFLLQQDSQTNSPTISQLPKNRAFLDLLPHAHCFAPDDPVDGGRLVKRYMELAEQVPVFHMKFGAGFHELPLLTQAVLDAAA